MRIDLVLKYLCLVKSRSVAKALCDQGRVLAGGVPVKSSAQVRGGDRVTVRFGGENVTVALDAVPEKQLSRSDALTYYHRVEATDLERRACSSDSLDEL